MTVGGNVSEDFFSRDHNLEKVIFKEPPLFDWILLLDFSNDEQKEHPCEALESSEPNKFSFEFVALCLDHSEMKSK